MIQLSKQQNDLLEKMLNGYLSIILKSSKYLKKELTLRQSFKVSDFEYILGKTKANLKAIEKELFVPIKDFSGREDSIGFEFLSEKELADLFERTVDMASRIRTIKQYIEAFDVQKAKIKHNKQIEAYKVPELSSLMEELEALKKHYGKVTVNTLDSSVTVSTKPITLISETGQSVSLGEFEMNISVRESNLTITAQAKTPNYHRTKKFYHPHIDESGAICLGEATTVLRSAYYEGKLFDMFEIIEILLSTYNPSSPYVKLSDWVGKTCQRCQCNTSLEEIKTCAVCGDEICGSCRVSVRGQIFCRTCLNKKELYCTVCNKNFIGVTNSKCSGCALIVAPSVSTSTAPTSTTHTITCTRCGERKEISECKECTVCHDLHCEKCSNEQQCDSCSDTVCDLCRIPCSDCKTMLHHTCAYEGDDGRLRCESCNCDYDNRYNDDEEEEEEEEE